MPRIFDPNLHAIHVQVFRFRGDLDEHDLNKLDTLLSEYRRAGNVHVVMNLEHVGHVALTGIPAIMEHAKTARKYGGDLKIVGASGYIRHCFKLLDVNDAALDFCGTEDEAMDHFAGKNTLSVLVDK